MEGVSTISKNLQGYSLIALKDLPIGTIVATKDLIPTCHSFIANSSDNNRKHVMVLRAAEEKIMWGHVRGMARYINHSCHPNCIAEENYIIVTRPVTRGEELNIAYDAPIRGIDKWDDEWTFVCHCESENCRGLINSFFCDTEVNRNMDY